MIRAAIRFLAVLIAVVSGAAWSFILARRMSHYLKFDVSGRPEMVELQAPLADNAFYLSYYYDVARSPTLAEGLAKLLADKRSEAPDTVNALHKFNVLPEFGVVMVQRFLGIAMSPYTFYIWMIILATGLGVFALSITAWLLGGSVFCSAASVLMYFSLCHSPSMQAGTRLGTSGFALREFWGVPAMLAQNAWLIGYLNTPNHDSRWASGLLLAFAAFTCVFELCWQFAPFVLLLQLLSLLGAYILACLPRQQLGELAAAGSFGTLAALLLSFGNGMLLCSPFFALAVAVSVAGLSPSPTKLVGRGGVAEAIWVALVAATLGAGGQQLLARVASTKEDQHVLELLLQKLGIIPPFASFDASLYLSSPEFGFLSMHHVWAAASAGSLPAAVAAAAMIVVGLLRRRILPSICCRKQGSGGANAALHGKSGSSNTQKPDAAAAAAAAMPSAEPPWSAWTAQVMFLIALVLLAVLVNRLRVLAAPILCLVGSLLASPSLLSEAVCRHWSACWIARVLGLVLTVAPIYTTGVPERVLQVGMMEPDGDMHELVQWANRSLGSEAIVMADMTLAAKLRMISPALRVANHPQYESVSSRARNRAYYLTFTCAAPERVYAALAKYGTTHVVLNANACRSRIATQDPFHAEADRCKGNKDDAEVHRKTFCWAGFLAKPGLFTLAFRSAIYTVLRLGNSTDATSDGATGKRAPGADINSVGTWRPWLGAFSDAAGARGLAIAAGRWQKMYGGFGVAQAMLQKAEGLLPEDPIVVLQRGQLQRIQRDEEAAYRSMEQAARLAGKEAQAAGKATPEDLHVVYTIWRELLFQQGHSARAHVKRIAKSLRHYLVASGNAWDLCDLAGWLQELKEPFSAELWQAAKNVSMFDSCVREDWSRWEGRKFTNIDTWRAFLGL